MKSIDLTPFTSISLCFENCELAEIDISSIENLEIKTRRGRRNQQYITQMSLTIKLPMTFDPNKQYLHNTTPLQRIQQFKDITHVTLEHPDTSIRQNFFVLWPEDNDYDNPTQTNILNNDSITINTRYKP